MRRMICALTLRLCWMPCSSIQLALEHARGAALALRADRTAVFAAVRKDGQALRSRVG